MDIVEIWRDVPGYEGCYQVSSFGRVKSLSRVRADGGVLKERVLRHSYTSDGYFQAVLCKNGKMRTYKLHRLVARAFIPNLDNKPHIDHIDGNKTNNKTDNLRWVTSLENNNNPITRKRKRGKVGIFSRCSKPVICIEKGILYFGCSEAERITRIGNHHIASVCNGKRKTAGGYHWRYATPEEIKQAQYK